MNAKSRHIVTASCLVMALLIPLIPGPLFSQRAFIQNASCLGMGGAGVAVLSDDNVFFYNPALLGGMTRSRYNIIEIGASYNPTLQSYIDFYRQNQSVLASPGDLSGPEREDLYDEAFDLGQEAGWGVLAGSGPLGISHIRKGFAFGLLSSTDLRGGILPGALNLPLIDFTVRADIVAILSFAQRIQNVLPGDFYVGTSVKYLSRSVWRKQKNLAGISAPKDLSRHQGDSYGFDLGLLYRLSPRLAVGLTVFDIFAKDIEWSSSGPPTDDEPEHEIPPTTRIGVALNPFQGFEGLVKHLTFALDVDRVFQKEPTFFKKIFFGFNLPLHSKISLRGGFHQGYPGMGFGLDLNRLRIDYAYYGKELGRFAGQNSNYLHIVRMQIGFSK